MFKYENGLLIRIVKTSNNTKVGDVVGTSTDTAGYAIVKIDGAIQKVHRMIWIYHNGAIEDKYIIDHKDRNKSNKYPFSYLKKQFLVFFHYLLSISFIFAATKSHFNVIVGKKFSARIDIIKMQKVKSCGCLQLEKLKEYHKKREVKNEA